MALNDNAVFNLSVAHFYFAVVGTAEPTDLSDLDEAWEEIGHTSLDNILQTSSEGGDVTTLGTLQAPTLLQSTSPRTDSWAFTLEQWDDASLKYYFGANATLSTPSGDDQVWLRVPDDPEATEVAFLIVMSSGSKRLAFHAQRVSIKRGDDLDFSDASSINGLPLSVTPLNKSGAPAKYSLAPVVINSDES